MTNLTSDQLMVILQNSPEFDGVAGFLSGLTQDKLMAMQQRAGDLYNSGEWSVPETGEKFSNPVPPKPLEAEEVSALLGWSMMELSTLPASGDITKAMQILEGIGEAMGFGSLTALNAAIIEHSKIAENEGRQTQPLPAPKKDADKGRGF